MNYFQKYTKQFPELLKERVVILLLEGLGEYKGVPHHSDLHPKGRMGAKLQVYIDGILRFETNNASTLPDEPCGKGYSGNGNDGSPIPTAFGGVVWDVYAKHHLGKLESRYNALEMGFGGENIEVVRDGKIDKSNAINIHYRPISDYTTTTYVTSAGCITILEKDNVEFLRVIGATVNGELIKPGTRIGKVLIDRSYISADLQKLYSSLYKGLYPKFLGEFKQEVIVEVKDEEASDWAKEAWNWAKEKGLLDGTRPKDCVTREEMSVVMYRLYQLCD